MNIETRRYADGFYIKRSIAEANVKLISWPEKQINAETTYVTDSPIGCTLYLNTGQMGENLVYVNNIDIWEWFLDYRD